MYWTRWRVFVDYSFVILWIVSWVFINDWLRTLYIFIHTCMYTGGWIDQVTCLTVFSVLLIHSVLHGELRRGAGLICLTEFEEPRKEYTIQNGWILPDIHRNGCLSRWVYLSCFCVFSMCIAVKWFNGPSLLTHSWTCLYHIRSRIYIARSCIVYARHLVYISTGSQAP